jgi:uncharacterized repeat protein (TIGR01451 family)/CSLREA domain-containing protein
MTTRQRGPARLLAATLALMAALAPLPPIQPAHAATFTVTRTDDPVPNGCLVGDCSLREAVAAANAAPGSAITLPAGTYNLQLPGPTYGGLNVTTGVSINGAGANSTIVDAHGLGRAFYYTTNDPSGNLGGGIRAGFTDLRSLTLTDLNITGNHASQGGGAYIRADLVTMNRVTFSGNTASGGAGLKLEISNPAASATLTNVTLSGNTATGAGGGLLVQGQPVALKHATIAGNAAPLGSGIEASNDATVSLRASILSGNTGGSNCQVTPGSTITSAGFNIDSGTSCGFTVGLSGDVNNSNPNLGPLQNNGGQTPTQAISAGSSAVDRINNSSTCPSIDQRGTARPQNGGIGNFCDAGAFEFQPRANIGVALSDAPDPVTVGSALTYTAQVSNAGPNTATGLVLTDVLPGNVSYVSSSTNVGSCSQASGTVTCTIGTLPSGGFAAVTIAVRAL